MVFSRARISFFCACAFFTLFAGFSVIAPAQSAPGQPDPQTSDSSSQRSSPPPSPRPPGAGQFPMNSSNGPVDFESRGMHYEALTKNGITVMFAALPPHVKDYNIVQITVTNGSPV